ncbi:MAG: adenine deaminase [Sphaerochaeta sp.]
MEKKTVQNLIAVAAHREEADLCITNAHILDVFNKEWFEEDLLITGNYIAGFAPKGEGKAKKIVDGGGRFLIPGLIDSHVHIESSHATPEEFSNLVVPHGTTTAIVDPHEICNVTGLDGLHYMLDASKETALQAFFVVPSCVPSVSFEHAGAVITAGDIATVIDHERVVGLGEMMDYPAVIGGEDLVIDKIMVAKEAGKIIDGHSPAVYNEELDAYAASGIKTDHECETPTELRDRIRRGMYVHLREGSACNNVLPLLGGVDSKNAQRCCFCTDDRQPISILEEGQINNNIRIAVNDGLDPIEAICMATLNSSECYGLHDRGAIAPGRRADFALANNLVDFAMSEVYVGGTLVAKEGVMIKSAKAQKDERVTSKMNIKDFSIEKLALPLKHNRVRVIDIVPGGVVTDQGEAYVKLEKGLWAYDSNQDVIKIAVVERHRGLGTVGVGLIRGFGLRNGALASTVGHDSHNLIVAGDNDEDMVKAVEHLISVGGGMTVVQDGKVLATLELPVAGLISYEEGRAIADKLQILHTMAINKLSVKPGIDAFTTLSFMALPVIPTYKLTDMGLFDVGTFSFVPLEID